MSTYTQIIYHLVFSTKKRRKTLTQSNQTELYKYIWGILTKKKCHLYRINGMEDHLHIALHLHPSIALSSLIKDIKLATSQHIKDYGLFKNFDGWQRGYGAFSYSFKDKDNLINYVKNQEENHKVITFREEFISLLNDHGVEFDEKYLL